MASASFTWRVGRLGGMSCVEAEGLQLLARQEVDSGSALTELRAKIAIGLEQAERGELLDTQEMGYVLKLGKAPSPTS
jgi:hypothetical protein